MGIVTLDSESVISHIVEGMLPRFSDEKLGLLIEIDMDIHDHGYGADGSTKERKEKGFRHSFCFLFHRPSNYTKTLFWEPKKDARGVDCTPFYSREVQEWYLECDHDSCWRDAIGSKMTDIYFRGCDGFKGRMKTGQPLRPIDLYQFHTFWRDPTYVQLETFEQKDKSAEHFSKESRTYIVKMNPITMAKLEMIESPDTKQIANSGLLIKGSENHQRYVNAVARYRK